MDNDIFENLVWLAIVTLISVIQNVSFAFKVEHKAKHQHSKSFQRTGSPSFEKVYSANQNCVDAYPTFLALLWCAGVFCSQAPAAFAGLIYLFVRQKYFVGYLGEQTQRIVQVKTMIEYAKVRKILTSKLLLILVSACEKKAGERRRRADNQTKVLKQFILIINGNNPMIKWEMERGLNDVFSSVSSENFTVKIDLKETLQKWTQDQGFAITVGPRTVTPDWLNTTFNLNYESDASCDFPYWFGFSKRRFSLHGKIVYLRNRTVEEKHNLEELFLAFVSEPS